MGTQVFFESDDPIILFNKNIRVRCIAKIANRQQSSDSPDTWRIAALYFLSLVACLNSTLISGLIRSLILGGVRTQLTLFANFRPLG